MFLLMRTISHRANLGRQIRKFLYMQAKANKNKETRSPKPCSNIPRSAITPLEAAAQVQSRLGFGRGVDVALRTWRGAGTLQVRSVAGHGDLHSPFQPR